MTADLIVPTTAGAGKLWSVEYWELARDALAPGGIMLQWVGDRRPEQYRMIVRSFQHVFPHTTAWAGGSVLVGTKQPLHVEPAAFACKADDPETAAVLADVGIPTFDALLGIFDANARALRSFVGDGPLLTDDRPRLEYTRAMGGEPEIDVSALRSDPSKIVSQASRGPAC